MAHNDVINDKQTMRLTYLMDQYKLYRGHINMMFNYFLLLSGLILNAFIQSLQKQADISPIVSICIALFGSFRHKYQFRITYWSVIVAFLAMAVYSMYQLYRSNYKVDDCSRYCLLHMV